MQTDVVNRILADVDLGVDRASIAQLGENSWSAQTPEGPVVLRLVQRSDVHALRAIHTLVDAPPERFRLLQRLRRCVDTGQGLLAVMEWVPGVTLRDGPRDELPAFFGQLAGWHRENAGVLPLYSGYTSREHSSVEEFLSEELALHLRTTREVVGRHACWERLQALTSGFPTYTHGDVHPGNIVRRVDGEYRLLDPEYLHVGVNYLDLDYVDWRGVETEPAPWWAIREQAFESVAAYFRALDVDVGAMETTMVAVSLLTALRSNTNAARRGTADREDLLRRLRPIIDGTPEPRGCVQ